MTVHVGLQLTRGFLVVPVQAEADDQFLHSVREQVLEKIDTLKIKGLIFDLSAVDILDVHMANHIASTAEIAHLLGVEAVVAGLKPAVVVSLIYLQFENKYLKTALSLEEAFRMLEPAAAQRDDEQEDSEELASETNDPMDEMIANEEDCEDSDDSIERDQAKEDS